MTAEQLAELTALVEDYPGPWETLGGYGFSQRRGYYLARDGLYLGRIGAPVRNEAVALCRLASAVPALLARIAELEAEHAAWANLEFGEDEEGGPWTAP